MRLVLVSLLLISCNKDEPPAATRAAPDPGMLTLAKHAVKKLAFEAFPEWSASHPDKACPASLADLGDATATTDPWGKPVKIFCGPTLPPGVRGGLGVVSMGPDGKPDTADDIRSWD